MITPGNISTPFEICLKFTPIDICNSQNDITASILNVQTISMYKIGILQNTSLMLLKAQRFLIAQPITTTVFGI